MMSSHAELGRRSSNFAIQIQKIGFSKSYLLYIANSGSTIAPHLGHRLGAKAIGPRPTRAGSCAIYGDSPANHNAGYLTRMEGDGFCFQRVRWHGES